MGEIASLHRRFAATGAGCGEPALNDWHRHRALRNESRFSRTYVVCQNNRMIAYFCDRPACG